MDKVRAVPNAVALVTCESVEDRSNVGFLEVSFPQVSVHGSENFEARDLAGAEAVHAARELTDPLSAGLVQVALGDVGGVEADHPRSRPCET